MNRLSKTDFKELPKKKKFLSTLVGNNFFSKDFGHD